MTPDDLTVGGLKYVLETVKEQNGTDHELIRKEIGDSEARLCRQLREGFDAMEQKLSSQNATHDLEDLDGRVRADRDALASLTTAQTTLTALVGQELGT